MEAQAPQDRPANLREGFGVLGVAIREQAGVFSIALLGSVVFAAMTVATASVIGAVTDRVIVPAFREGRTTAGALTGAVAAIIGVALLKAAGIVVRRIGGGVMTYRLQASSRRRVTRQYLRLPLSWHQRHPTGELLSNAGSDVEATWYPIPPLPLATGVLVMIAIAGAAMVIADPVLALVGLAVFPTLFAVNFAYQRKLSPLATRAQQLRGELSTVAHESFDGALVVKALGREREETARFAVEAEKLRNANIAIGRIRGLFDPMLEALPSLGVLAVLLVGAIRIDRGLLDPGTLVQVAYLFTIISFPVRAIGWVLGELPRAVVGWRRLRRVLDAKGEMPYGSSAARAHDGPAGASLRGVDYAYDGHPVLHAATFDIVAGTSVAVVGRTGSGKSTLAGLLVRLVDPRSGEVLLDGVDLRALRHGEVSAAAALVPQQTFLFDDTVRGNVTLDAPISDEAVWTALRRAQADAFVTALPAGLDTEVGERGTTLSGGQRQRLALARALVREPRLLVLDDSTSAVDTRVEARILAALREADPPTTVVVVAYRKATIAVADEVVFVEAGRVVDRGPHEELLARSSAYRDLVTAYERDAAERAALRAEAGPEELAEAGRAAG